MVRNFAITISMLFAAAPAFGHFVFIVPEQDGKSIKVVMSESLEVDDAVALGPVASLKLNASSIDGKISPLTLQAAEHHLTGAASGPQVVFGSLDYGVTSRGGQSFLLKYHPKVIVGCVPTPKHRLTKVAAQIEPERTPEGLRFRVFAGEQSAGVVDVTVLLPDGESKKVKTDSEGRTPVFAATGRYGVWARVMEETPGEYQDKKYSHVRHYPTLVVDHSTFPPLPEAVSSFGAAVADGWVYVYGGHRAKVHTYDTGAVTGGWRRLNLTQPKVWEELPAGPSIQGLALAAHKGKLYRIGGMAPRNAPGTPTDNHSTAACAVYDPAKKAWEDLPALPKPRSSHDAVVVGDSLVVVGGWNMRGAEGNDWLDDTLVLDLNNIASGWKSTPQPFRRRAFQSGVFDNRVYSVGGLDEDESVVSTVSIFDPAKNTWTDGPDLPGGGRKGFSPGICTSSGGLYVSMLDGSVIRLSADGSKWEPVSKVNARVVHRMVPAGDQLLMIGGALAGENLDSVESIAVSKQ